MFLKLKNRFYVYSLYNLWKEQLALYSVRTATVHNYVFVGALPGVSVPLTN